MKKYYGGAGILINEMGELLMVLQGTPEEVKKWSVPSGGKNEGESFEECCVREFEEETGYKVEIVKPYYVKKEMNEEDQFDVEIHYFTVHLVGGGMAIQDPDQFIYDIAWKSIDELKGLELSFPGDRGLLIECMQNEILNKM
ncbi:NUDIX hydrolase [Pseudoneobacillus sp. C159]